jgi:hypothetical protein
MLAGLGVYDGAAGGSAADPEFPGRIECCSSKCALPEELIAGALVCSVCAAPVNVQSHVGRA